MRRRGARPRTEALQRSDRSADCAELGDLPTTDLRASCWNGEKLKRASTERSQVGRIGFVSLARLLFALLFLKQLSRLLLSTFAELADLVLLLENLDLPRLHYR